MLEFGCGYGTFTLPAARRVQGRVYALDIEPEMTCATAAKAREAGLANIETGVRDFLAHGSGRPDRSIDYAMLFNILHIEQPAALLNEAYRVLKPGGKLGVIHWRRNRPTPRGPSLEIRPTLEQCRDWAKAAGFEFVRSEELCCCSWHWGLVMRRP